MPATGHLGAASTGADTTASPDTWCSRNRTGVELVELVCADPEWVQREFTELIEANYPPAAAAPARVGPPCRTGVATGAGPRPTRQRPGSSRSSRVGPRVRRRYLALAKGPARQRSPPGRAPKRVCRGRLTTSTVRA